MKIFALSGSLRADSSSTKILLCLPGLAASDVAFDFYNNLGDLPHFTPDLDTDDAVPLVVSNFRDRIAAADAVVICTPEYIHGVPGSLKNALDWCASSAVLDGKPVAVISVSPSERGGDRAHASLVQTLRVLGARVAPEGMLILPFIRRKITAEGALSDTETSKAIELLLRVISL